MEHDLTEARKHAKWDADAAAIAWAQNRIEELEAALRQIADDPCLDPEGNADIARKALQKSDQK